MKVIIAGGGIGGLALANAFQKLDIDYVLIEKGDCLDPDVGASIGIMPNAARILDQLDCYSDISKLTINLDKTAERRSDGSLIGGMSDTMDLMGQRTGYAIFFLHRQKILHVLAEHVEDKSKIMLNTVMEKIEQDENKVRVHCKGGAVVEGDVIVGCDGTYSLVRREMWRHADENGDGEKFAKDKDAMSAEYRCMFGISDNIRDMMPGEASHTYAKDNSTLSYVGNGGEVFWFLFSKMDKTYYPPNIPKFGEDDAEALIANIGDLVIQDKPKVDIHDLYKNRTACSLVAIEEALYDHWSYDRLVCIGDAVHKMTPNLGAGATSAIEDAADLANVIADLVAETEAPSVQDINTAFARYQKAREDRVAKATQVSKMLTRVQSLRSLGDYVFSHWIAPIFADFAADSISEFTVGSSIIDRLPTPKRSVQGTMPFNPRKGWGYEDSRPQRLLSGIPLLALAIGGLTLQRHPAWIGQVGLVSATQNRTLPVLSDLVNADVAYGIVLLEANRVCNIGTPIALPVLFGLVLQKFHAAFTVPLYLFLLHVQSSQDNFLATDNRLTDVRYTSTAGALVLLLGVLPKSFFFLGGGNADVHLQLWSWLITLQPVLLSVAQYLLAQFVLSGSMREDRLGNVRRDVPWLRGSAACLFLAAAATWLWTGAVNSPVWSRDVSVDLLFFGVGVCYWLALVRADFGGAGMVKAGWWKVALGCAAGMVGAGPGGVLALGWLLREEVLVHRRHKHAVTEAG